MHMTTLNHLTYPYPNTGVGEIGEAHSCFLFNDFKLYNDETWCLDKLGGQVQ